MKPLDTEEGFERERSPKWKEIIVTGFCRRCSWTFVTTPLRTASRKMPQLPCRGFFAEPRHTRVTGSRESVSNQTPLARLNVPPIRSLTGSVSNSCSFMKCFFYQTVFFVLNIPMFICNAATFSTEMQNVPENICPATSLASA